MTEVARRRPPELTRSQSGSRDHHARSLQRKEVQKPPKGQPQPKSPHPGTVNRLNRETPFLCNIRFRNDLPEIPCDPRMLVAPVHPEKLAQYGLTTLEENMRREYIVDTDDAIPVSMLDVDRYCVPQYAMPLAPEDAVLLQEDVKVAMDGTRSHSKPTRNRKPGSELSWLMRTSYISNEVDTKTKQQGIGEKRAKAIREADDGIATDDLEAQIAAIEATFEAATKPPIHPTNPDLVAEEISPVMPDFERWANNYVLITFDNDPTEDHERLSSLDAASRRSLIERSAVKSYSLGKGDKGQTADRFVAFLVPGNVADLDTFSWQPDEESDYEWVREYNYQIQQEEGDERKTYVFRFEGGQVSYAHIHAKLTLSKRGKHTKGEQQAQDFPRPSKVTLKRRPLNDGEEQMQSKRMRELTGGRESPRRQKSPQAGVSGKEGGAWGSPSPSLSD